MDVFTPKYVRLMSPPHCPSIYLSMDFYWVGDDRNSQDWTLTNCTVKSDSIRLELAKIEKKLPHNHFTSRDSPERLNILGGFFQIGWWVNYPQTPPLLLIYALTLLPVFCLPL